MEAEVQGKYSQTKLNSVYVNIKKTSSIDDNEDSLNHLPNSMKKK